MWSMLAGAGVNAADQRWPWCSCCYLRVFNSNRFNAHVPELSLIFCATGQECVQLRPVYWIAIGLGSDACMEGLSVTTGPKLSRCNVDTALTMGHMAHGCLPFCGY